MRKVELATPGRVKHGDATEIMKTVRNAVRALQMLGPENPELGVSAVSETLGIPKSSASRLLAALGEGGLLEQDPSTRRYRAGWLALRLASLYRNRAPLLDRVQEAMEQLAKRTGHSCWMLVLSEGEVLVLRNIHGGYPVRFVVEPGRRLPIHSTAAGKALLARLGEDELSELLPSGKLPRITAKTVATAKELKAELARVRRLGYAVSDQENFAGIRSIAVAFAGVGAPPVALSLSYPLSSLPKSGDGDMVEALLSAAKLVGRQLGDPWWVGRADPG